MIAAKNLCPKMNFGKKYSGYKFVILEKKNSVDSRLLQVIH